MSEKLFSNASTVEETLVGNSNTLDIAVVGYIDYLLGFLYLVAVLFIIYSGFQILTAADQDDKKDSGKATFKISLLALIIIFIADPLIGWLIGSVIGGDIEDKNNENQQNETEYIEDITIN